MNAIKDSHIALTATHDIQEICKPLSKLLGNIGFGYHKLFPNGKEILLSNDLSWVKNVHQKNLAVGSFIDSLGVKNAKIMLWPFDGHLKIYTDVRQLWDCHYGLSLMNGCNEYFGFTIKNTKDISTINILMNHMQELENFCQLFLDKAQNIVDHAAKDMIIYHKKEGIIKANGYFKQPPFTHTKKISDRMHLTSRENDCLKLFIRGYTSTETAMTLGISKRTVETHLENIKNKTGISSKNNLIKFIFSNKLDNFFL